MFFICICYMHMLHLRHLLCPMKPPGNCPQGFSDPQDSDSALWNPVLILLGGRHPTSIDVHKIRQSYRGFTARVCHPALKKFECLSSFVRL